MRTILKMEMASTRSWTALKAFSTAASEHFLLRLGPISRQRCAHDHHRAMDRSNTPKPVVRATVVSLEIWAKRMVTREHTVAVLVSKENR